MTTDLYIKLIKKFPLVPIRDEEHLETAISVIDDLLSRKKLATEEQAYLSVLADQVHQFEERLYPTPELSPLDLLKSLIEVNGLKGIDLVPLFGTKSVVSEILNGKRELSKTHIANLSAYFSLSPAAFFQKSKVQKFMDKKSA